MEQISSLFWEIKKLPLAGGLVIGALAVGAPNLRVRYCSSFDFWAVAAQKSKFEQVLRFSIGCPFNKKPGQIVVFFRDILD